MIIIHCITKNTPDDIMTITVPLPEGSSEEEALRAAINFDLSGEGEEQERIAALVDPYDSNSQYYYEGTISSTEINSVSLSRSYR